MLILLPLLVVLFNGFAIAHVEANLSLEFTATRLSRQHNPANCTVGNTTYIHGQTFKLDCKTQCVCENGRHACSSLCPKEQLPAPEDTISCRSPRLVEVPGHCCKMWLCENPTADVYATCHNASTSPWTPCSQPCGLGVSTRYTNTNTGCRQLSSLRLCENRKCDQDNNSNSHSKYNNNNNNNSANNNTNNANNNSNYLLTQNSTLKQKTTAAQQHQAQQHQKSAHEQLQKKLISHNAANNLVVSEPKDIKDITNYHASLYEHEEHRIRKGHECRNIQRLGPARVRLGACISKKLYRPKLCGRCHQHSGKCCTPSVSTTIQVELLCPLNADDPISFAEQQQRSEGQAPLQLWDSLSLEPIDQEFLQSHQIQIENKFIAVEWILKCECSKDENCKNQQKYNTTPTMLSNRMGNNGSNGYYQNNVTHQNNNNNKANNSNKYNNNNNTININWFTSTTIDNHNNNTNPATNIISNAEHNYNRNAYSNNNNDYISSQNNNNADSNNGKAYNEKNIFMDDDSDNRYVRLQKQQQEIVQQQQQSYIMASGELQPDIIPYPTMLAQRGNNRFEEKSATRQASDDNNNKSNNNKRSNHDDRKIFEETSNDDDIHASTESDSNYNNNNNMKSVKSAVMSNKNNFVAGFRFYGHEEAVGNNNVYESSTESDDYAKKYGSVQWKQELDTVAWHEQDEEEEEEKMEQAEEQMEEAARKQQLRQQQQQQQHQEWEFEKNLHYQQLQETITTATDTISTAATPFRSLSQQQPHWHYELKKPEEHERQEQIYYHHHQQHHNHQHIKNHHHQRHHQHQHHSHQHPLPHPVQQHHHLLQQIRQRHQQHEEQQEKQNEQHASQQRRRT